MIILKILKRIPTIIFRCLFLPIWWIEKFFPRDKNLWIFSSWFGKKYSDSARIFFEYVNKNCPKIKTVWFSKDKNLVQKLKSSGFNACYSYSFKAFLLSLKAGKVFTTTGGEFFLGFFNEAEYYGLWHGMPLKKILRDDEFSGGTNGHKNFFAKFYDTKITSKFKWILFYNFPKLTTITNSKFFMPFLKSAFNLPEEKILKIGLPRNDALFYKKEEKLINKIRKDFPNSKILLYMPTFRTSAWTKKVFDPFSSKFLFDEEKLHEILVRKNVVLVYKPHFYDLQFVNRKNASDRFLTIKEDDFDELYNFVGQVDILMTDYSSIYFDFILTRKPVILSPFDFEEYVTTCRTHYFDYSELEGKRATNWNEVLKIIDEESYFSVSENKVKQFAEFCEGNSCEKLLKCVLGE